MKYAKTYYFKFVEISPRLSKEPQSRWNCPNLSEMPTPDFLKYPQINWNSPKFISIETFSLDAILVWIIKQYRRYKLRNLFICLYCTQRAQSFMVAWAAAGPNTGQWVRSTESFLVNLDKAQIHLKIESVQYSENLWWRGHDFHAFSINPQIWALLAPFPQWLIFSWILHTETFQKLLRNRLYINISWNDDEIQDYNCISVIQLIDILPCQQYE